MYDFPHLAQANDAMWQSIRSELGHGPEALTRGRDPWSVWTDPELVLAQTCGLPYRARLYGILEVVGTPDYGLRGCMPGYYYSVIVAHNDGPDRIDGFDHIRFALNDSLSQSGWGAPQALLKTSGVPYQALPPTQSHAASAWAVAQGLADLAAIDVVTWGHLRQAEPMLVRSLKIIAETPPTPGLPFVTRRGGDRLAVAQAVERGVAKMDGLARNSLGIRGVVPLSDAAYLALPIPPMV